MNQEIMQDELCGCRCIHRERVERARQRSLASKENERVAGLFKAMGDPNRLRILWALSLEEMCVCDLALFLGVSESAVSHQLRILRTLSLVSNRRDGQILYYRASDDHIRELIELGLTHTREAD